MKKKGSRYSLENTLVDGYVQMEIDSIKGHGTHTITGPKKEVMKMYLQADPLNSPMKPYKRHRNGYINLKPFVDWYDENRIGILKR